ncbi:MAG: DUF167 domain-containing protein [bacterium]|nr:DUF167 domain-containing protein [bacterium]
MKIYVQVKAGAKNNLVEKIDETHFKVSVIERPIKNKANLKVIEVLANYFKIPKSKVILTSGETSKQKAVEILK